MICIGQADQPTVDVEILHWVASIGPLRGTIRLSRYPVVQTNTESLGR